MSQEQGQHDPIDFMKQLWGGMGMSMPGMVTPSLDVDEIDKRIAEFKAVEGWLKMNLSMLQTSIQGLEIQRTTLKTMQAMAEGNDTSAQNPFNAAMWPWQFMAAATAQPAAEPAPEQTATAKAARTTTRQRKPAG